MKFFKHDKQGISSKRCEFPCPQQRITFVFFLNACLPKPPKRRRRRRFFPFSTPWLRLASTRAEFEQTATGLLTKLEKGLQSAQEAPFFWLESQENDFATSQQKNFLKLFV